MRSIAQFLYSFHVPAYLTGITAKLVVVSGVALLTVGYVVQISHLTTGGYEIARLEKQLATLSDESERLSTQVAEQQSISSVQKRLEGLSMVPAQNIKYVKVAEETAVAQR